ncbi:MAG: hypothetical protein NWE93_08220 [Candidatus Bathyarchaeota archaeon]|nr:hypothetical protein [Candidatus Bathyarchaeota archaeon]
MVKAALITPAYLSVAWALMVSYQIFTETAVETVLGSLTLYVPFAGLWLGSHIDMVVFVYSFAWVFVLSSIIPVLILGKERSVFVQFIVCLAMALLGFILVDFFKTAYNFDLSNSAVILSNPYTWMFSNIFFAIFYLSLPYIFMLAIDYRGRRKNKSQQEHVKQITKEYFDKQQTQSTQPQTAPPA